MINVNEAQTEKSQINFSFKVATKWKIDAMKIFLMGSCEHKKEASGSIKGG
jgi:hypothetical protein